MVSLINAILNCAGQGLMIVPEPVKSLLAHFIHMITLNNPIQHHVHTSDGNVCGLQQQKSWVGYS
jgi:hypothetical protein